MPGVVLAVTDHDPAGQSRTTQVMPGAEDDLAQPPAFGAGAIRRVFEWAQSRALRPSSVSGISVALSLCAAVWFTAGSRTGNFWAALALAGSYVAMLGARTLATGPGRSWRARGVASVEPAHRALAGWLAALGWSVSESAVLAGMAIGAITDRWSGMWILAIAVLSMVAIRDLMTACAWPAGHDGTDQSLLRRAVAEALRMPPGGRVLLIAAAAPIWGTRAVLLALLDWTIIAVGFGLASMQGPRRERPAVAAAGSAPQAAQLGLAVLLPAADGAAGLPLDPAAVDALEVPGDDAEPEPEPAPPDQPFPAGASRQPGPQAQLAAWQDRLVMLRDDGMLARNLGALVRGNLLPLPPAILGLAATGVLAYLGLRSVPGILILSPCLIMLLAAPGSGNRHAGRLDWLVPAVLLGWQCLYLTIAGQAQGVPAPATFALCAALAVRYADLGSRS